MSEPAHSCVWTPDEDGIWQTDCGQAWVFETDRQVRDLHFCHTCGRPVSIRLTLECPSCGDEGAVSDAEGMFTEGQPLICGCLGSVSVDEDDGPWISLDEDRA